MSKNSFRVFLGCMAAIVALSCAEVKAEKNDLIDLNGIAVNVELYAWNRISDLLDIVRFGCALGPGIGFEFAITDYVQLGAYANIERGIDFPHIFPPFWLIDYYEHNSDVFVVHGGRYATASFGPFRKENVTDKSLAATPHHFLRYDPILSPSYKWDIRVQADLLLIHPCIDVRTLEIWDFLAGIVGADPSMDDQVKDPGIVRKPADQFGRGICNIAFGVFEIPLNVMRVKDADGDLPALSKGVGLGVWRFFVREVVGVTELVTFPFGWDPIIEPEYVFHSNSENQGWRVFKPSFHKRY